MRVETIDQNGNPIATVGQYAYDGDGKRVKKVVPGTGETTIFVYDATGKSIAEYSTIVASVEDAKVAYLTADHLGSPRINTDATGQVISRRDFHPFDEEISTAERTAALGYQPDDVKQKFTGYERDGETDLDFAQARMYAKSLGRFTGADPVAMTSERPSDPQRPNLYVYVRNNPLIFTDPNGLDLYFELTYDSKGKATNLGDAKQYKQALEKGTGLKLHLDKKTGQLTIKSEPKSLSGAAAQLKTIIGDSSAAIKVGASNNDPTILGGRFDGGGHQTLDFTDIKKLSKKGGFTKESIVIHETTEAYEGRNTASGTSLTQTMHNTAIGFENDVRAKQGLSPRVTGSDGATLSADGKTIDIVIDFTTHRETITVDSNNPGNIKKVKVDKKP